MQGTGTWEFLLRFGKALFLLHGSPVGSVQPPSKKAPRQWPQDLLLPLGWQRGRTKARCPEFCQPQVAACGTCDGLNHNVSPTGTFPSPSFLSRGFKKSREEHVMGS